MFSLAGCNLVSPVLECCCDKINNLTKGDTIMGSTTLKCGMCLYVANWETADISLERQKTNGVKHRA